MREREVIRLEAGCKGAYWRVHVLACSVSASGLGGRAYRAISNRFYNIHKEVLTVFLKL
jgi:hypothetical protein